MFKQIELPYGTNALEPVIDQLTVETHHGKHHKTYTDNLNAAAEKAGVQDQDIEALLADLGNITDPADAKALRNNGGGFYNHNLYFSTLSPESEKKDAPTGKLAEKIDAAFGSLDAFKEKINALAVGQFGSGWAFLSANQAGDLFLSASPNQDNPISEGTGNIPILAIDVWEHAYYLQYKNLRASYVKELWRVIDWKKVEAIYERVVA